ncbi:ATP-dependent protease ATPase subunit HslU [Nitratidesulfovibrio sp. SRB-5]|uniref:ATP-dependent protease ATPase subunit HslU n=1 Tax=Nitratidesulfovibrio sp. SRB-5 TaxID=2872636 RepID=UPI001025ECF2|nr:ATP-dependent protease ATPase subunit HslU [Nitratidesulfovibrio sp. SRB-5]MBZ2171691.1 ATP-dependent protease ATPase subunit HslU [Nitratidesulfovibrio sp. SRB-5]RXF76549.1 ATP-dependent protease ATPase subunit HslU [Desulfovibrio sp. DS-1]
MSNLTPREIVSELDKYIVGQNAAKRMVAVAMRNRWRRQQLDPALRDEIAPKNIIMMGPTGVGKTEIARRLAKLSASPFIKVEATKFTEVGYVGRDVESMVRDLMEIGIALVRAEENEKVRVKAEARAEERLLDLLLPGGAPQPAPAQGMGGLTFDLSASHSGGQAIPQPPAQADASHASPPTGTGSVPDSRSSTREKLRTLWHGGKLDDREVDMEVEESGGPQVGVLSMPGLEDVGSQVRDMFSKVFPSRRKRRRMKVRDAFNLLTQEEADRLIDHDRVSDLARERVEQTGIIFIDEIDKIASGSTQKSSDVSREGVQRDLLPIVEGSVVNTKYGMVRTDHILFIAAGAFHFSKPSDLIPELQGRFPLRAELSALGKDDFLRILTEPHNALTRQYTALLQTEGVHIEFTGDALREIAAFAEETNAQTENIGARRLYTILEKILADLSFEAPDRSGDRVTVDSDYVREHLADVRANKDLSRYIL